MNHNEKEQIITETFGDFPLRLSFHLICSKDGNYSIIFKKVKSKIQIKNIKLSALQLYHFDGSISTPLEVGDFEDYNDFDNRLVELEKLWL